MPSGIDQRANDFDKLLENANIMIELSKLQNEDDNESQEHLTGLMISAYRYQNQRNFEELVYVMFDIMDVTN